MQTISSATRRTRLLSGSNGSPLRNGVIGMGHCSLVTGGSATGLSVTDAWVSSAVDDLFSLAQWSVKSAGKHTN